MMIGEEKKAPYGFRKGAFIPITSAHPLCEGYKAPWYTGRLCQQAGCAREAQDPTVSCVKISI